MKGVEGLVVDEGGSPEEDVARNEVDGGCGSKEGNSGMTFDMKRRVPGDRGGSSRGAREEKNLQASVEGGDPGE